MINSFTQSSKYVTAYMGSNNDPYFSMSAPSAGMLRFNGDSRQMEVYDGTSWRIMSGNSASVSLNPDAEKAIDWALKKMQQEKDWYELASNNEAVRIALEQLEQAKTRVELTAILAREYEQTTN
jgi:Xaa-Pro aminopeptidase